MILLETARLTIRPVEMAEAPDVAGLITENISHWTSRIPWPYSLTDAKEWISTNRPWSRLGIYLKEKLIGTICCPISDDEEMGFIISEQHRNKGYITEAAREVIKFAFHNPALNYISSSAHPENTASLRVHEKLGFKKHKDTTHFWPNKNKEMPVILLRLYK